MRLNVQKIINAPGERMDFQFALDLSDECGCGCEDDDEDGDCGCGCGCEDHDHQ